jgi:hypothetical protein
LVVAALGGAAPLRSVSSVAVLLLLLLLLLLCTALLLLLSPWGGGSTGSSRSSRSWSSSAARLRLLLGSYILPLDAACRAGDAALLCAEAAVDRLSGAPFAGELPPAASAAQPAVGQTLRCWPGLLLAGLFAFGLLERHGCRAVVAVEACCRSSVERRGLRPACSSEAITNSNSPPSLIVV